MPLPPAHLDAVARTVHEALRGWAAAHGQHDIPAWDEAPDWMHASTRESVRHALEHHAPNGRTQHDQWLAQKVRDGWVHGPVKDAAAKTHPLMVLHEGEWLKPWLGPNGETLYVLLNGLGLLWMVVELGKLAFGRKKYAFDESEPFAVVQPNDEEPPVVKLAFSNSPYCRAIGGWRMTLTPLRAAV